MSPAGDGPEPVSSRDYICTYMCWYELSRTGFCVECFVISDKAKSCLSLTISVNAVNPYKNTRYWGIFYEHFCGNADDIVTLNVL